MSINRTLVLSTVGSIVSLMQSEWRTGRVGSNNCDGNMRQKRNFNQMQSGCGNIFLGTSFSKGKLWNFMPSINLCTWGANCKRWSKKNKNVFWYKHRDSTSSFFAKFSNLKTPRGKFQFVRYQSSVYCCNLIWPGNSFFICKFWTSRSVSGHCRRFTRFETLLLKTQPSQPTVVGILQLQNLESIV